MAITQDKTNRLYLSKMGYDLTTHRLYPLNKLAQDVGVDMENIAYTKELGDIELRSISDTIYDYMFSHMPPQNQEKVLAMIAENTQDEQITMARSFQAMIHFVLKGGDEVSRKTGINFSTGTYIEPSLMDKMSLGLEVKRILQNGNGKNGVWFTGEMLFTVADITDLVFGVDY